MGGCAEDSFSPTLQIRKLLKKKDNACSLHCFGSSVGVERGGDERACIAKRKEG